MKETKPKITTLRYIENEQAIFIRYNKINEILHIQNQINNLIENCYNGKMKYVKNSYDNLANFKGSIAHLEDIKQYWEDILFNLLDKREEKYKTPITSPEEIQALDYGIIPLIS